jgi:hypothetical protein
MVKSDKSESKFRFRQMDRIGAPDASEDQAFLSECFVDIGLLDVLRDVGDSRRIVLGRTGSGKTALLLHLENTEPRCIRIEPESLALPYVSNSTVLDFVCRLGVKLDVFFRLLWRHVFTVELLRSHFQIANESDSLGLWQKIGNLISGNRERHQQALDYLKKWGQSFWKETDYRIRELTDKLETDLTAAIKPSIGNISFDLEATRKLTTEKKQEVVHNAQHVVNEVQIRQLSDIINLIDDVLDDPQKKYFVIIDRLDENWVDEKIRYLLIRALIETARDFRKVKNVKIVLGLRVDLVERVFRETRDAGFQEEKYESLFCNLDWTPKQLRDVLNKRVGRLVRQRYTTQPVEIEQILPKDIDDKTGITYLIDRTLLRPRDAIVLFNACVAQAVDNPVVTADALRKAEGEYSRARLGALADEWHADYPNLMKYVQILKGRSALFPLSDLCESAIADFCLELATNPPAIQDEISSVATRVAEGADSILEFARSIVAVFYKLGVVGVKLATFESVAWSLHGRRAVSQAELDVDVRVAIHPAFWRVLGINPKTAVEQ